MGSTTGRGPVPARKAGKGPRVEDAFGDMTTRNGDSGIERHDPLKPFLPEAPRRNTGGLGDILGTLLAVAADAADPHGRGLATKNLAATWGKRREDYEEKLTDYKNAHRMANLPGMNEREMAAYIADPKAWGSNMSKAATSRYDAATLNPGDQRFLGEGNGVYQAPTRGQLYAQTLGHEPGTDAYSTAIRDQELGAQGPTAFQNNIAMEDHRFGNQSALEGKRHTNRAYLEALRHRNRVGLKRIPPPPRLGGPRTGGGSSAGGIVSVSTPEEAEALPSGTTFRMPNGRIKIRP